MATLVLTCNKTSAKSGETLTFTWNSVDSNAYKEFQFYELSPSMEMEALDLSQRSITTIFPEGLAAGASAYYLVQARPILDSGTFLISNSVSVTALDDTEEEPTPDTPTLAAGRLEQFQNSEGTNIYPKTVLEGVFRQRDGKKLEEILEESGGVTMEQVNAAIQQAVLDSWEGNY